MIKSLTPHFSRKILFLSLIFVLANLGIYGLRSLVGSSEPVMPVVPHLVSAIPGDIEVMSAYDSGYKPATEGQMLYSGSQIRTEEKEFAELVLGENAIRLDENTEIRLLKNNSSGAGAFMADEPRLEIELLSGGIWVNAFDLIRVSTKQGVSDLHHSVGILTYSEPLNRVMVVTGDADLSLLDKSANTLTDFVVPLGSQVTFLDTQLTDLYAALKPSKLKKELKMSPIASDILTDDWVVRNADDFRAGKEAFSEKFITSELAYRAKTGYQKAMSYLAFTPESKRRITLERAQTMLSFLLGKVQDDNDRARAKEIITEFDSLVALKNGDPKLQELVVETLFAIENAKAESPAGELRESLIQRVAKNEGVYVYRIYLTDLRRALYEKDEKSAEKAAEKWLSVWPESLSAQNNEEYGRQSQILNHTILSFADRVPLSVLTAFDETGLRRLNQSSDVEETRYEVASERLQITASLISNYRYLLAKQYLKTSYLSLDIDNLSPQLASTQVFLETGKLLAQRIEYAEAMLHGAAEAIDETKFKAYFETLKRDEALSADLRKFFDLDEEEAAVQSAQVEAPTASEVAARFLDARINVNYADINLVPSSGFYYEIKNARLMDRGEGGEILSFDAEYDYASNSVTNVISDSKKYQGSFTLTDLVTLLKSGGKLDSRIPTPNIEEEGIELLITDRDKIEAQEGQAIAQDIARQLAYNQLEAEGIVIPEPKFDIDITDTLNLNRFNIKKALIPRPDENPAVIISFHYSSADGKIDNVRNEEGVLLISQSSIKELAEMVINKVMQLEKQAEAAANAPKLPGASTSK